MNIKIQKKLLRISGLMGCILSCVTLENEPCSALQGIAIVGSDMDCSESRVVAMRVDGHLMTKYWEGKDRTAKFGGVGRWQGWDDKYLKTGSKWQHDPACHRCQRSLGQNLPPVRLEYTLDGFSWRSTVLRATAGDELVFLYWGHADDLNVLW